MKKITLAILISLCSTVYSQDSILDIFQSKDNNFQSIKLHHLKNQQSVDFKVMYAKLGYAYELNYGKFLSDKAMFHIGLCYEVGKINYSDFNYKNIKVGMSYTVFKIKQRFYLSPDISLFVGNITGYSNDLETGEVYLNYGGSLGLNLEVFVFNRLSILLNFDEQYNFKDKFGNLHYNSGLGLRFYINN